MEIKQEELSDLPLIAHFIQASGLSEKLDKHYPSHGNWSAPSFGKMVMGWLMYIISECDHRLYTVEDWAQKHRGLLGHLLDYAEFDGHCFHDDRLGVMLERLSYSEPFNDFMEEYTKNLLFVYQFPKTIVRVDSFNVPSFRESSSDGLFRFGYSKSHQADEPHLKTMVACMDPLSLPVAMLCAPGSQCDDELYLPVIDNARKNLDQNGLLYVGDSKLGSLLTCSALAEAGDFYLCPLSNSYLPRGLRSEYIQKARAASSNELQTLNKRCKTGKEELTDKVFELEPAVRKNTENDFTWTERRIMVYSYNYAKSKEEQLREKVLKAKKEIEARFTPKKYGKKWYVGEEDKAQEYINKVLNGYNVASYLKVSLCVAQPKVDESPSKSARQMLSVEAELNEQAINEKIENMGWRLYVTNVSTKQMDAKEILICYRNEYLIEHQFHKILTKTTSLLPIFLKKDNRCVALINLVILAMQFVSIIQHDIRKQMERTQQCLTDVVPGNKSRKVDKPTAELLLKRFKGIQAVWVKLPDQTTKIQLLHFEPIHAKIIELLGCQENLYIMIAQKCFP